MKPSADTSLNWYFYILYSAFIWGYVVVRLLCGYSWDNILPVLIVWFLTCIAWYVNWSLYTIKRLELENEHLRSEMEETSSKKEGNDESSVCRSVCPDPPGRAVYTDFHRCPYPQHNPQAGPL